MMRHPIARVVQNQLTPIAGSDNELLSIPVGTGAWYAWLNARETRSFAYHASEGRLTVRREARQGCWYWYAYRMQDGKLRKVYLGKAEEVSQQRLDDALRKLTQQAMKTPIQENCSLPSYHHVLLKTKLALPPTPEHLVTRPRLLYLLQAGAVKPLTLVCAPAGFGKTTLVREWVAQSGRSCAWISLDNEDNDPSRFLAYLIEALQQVYPSLGSAILARFHTLSHLALTEPIAVLLNELSVLPAELTIIFDNYQMIENQLIHDALTFLLAHLPSHVHMLIASRSELLCPLARLRASGQMIELGAEALRFTHEETETLLVDRMKLALRPAELATLAQRTEGWIAGLHLARCVMQEQNNLAHCVATFAGNNRYILAYLLEEVFGPQPEHMQAFLLHTSLLECFNGSLCYAVTGQANAEDMLEHLERANLFLFVCEKQAGWYRYHQLLAEALRHHLERTQPELVAILHARASQWFEAHDLLEKAIEHALAAHDNIRAVALIEQVVQAFLVRGEVTTLHGWLAALPNAVVRARPRLCITSAWIVFITSQPDTFLGWVEAAEQALYVLRETLPMPTTVELHSEIVGLRAIYSISFNDFSSAIATCSQALQHLPKENHYPRGLLLLMLGFAYVRGMNVGAGAQAMSEASSILQATGHALLLPYVIVGQAELYLTQAHPVQAAKLCRQILTLATEQNVPAIFAAGIAHAGLGGMFWEWNNLDAARHHLLQAWDLGMQTQTGKTLFTAALLLIFVSQAQGDAHAADFWLQQMEILAQKVGQIETFELITTSRARLLLIEGRLDDALLWMRERHDSLEDLTSRRDEFDYFTQARVLIAAGRAYADGSYVRRALELLERLRVPAEEAGRVRSLLEALILQALALQLEGESAGALTALGRAVSLAEPGRYIRLFVDEGDPMAKLLRHLFEQQRALKIPGQTISLTYLSNLLKAFTQTGASTLPTSATEGEPLLDPLSWREHEVLRLLAVGRKNREIADELVVVTGTVKAHINTIYQKLGVSSRVQAVVRARTLGLL